MRLLYTLLLSLMTPVLLFRASRKYAGQTWGFGQRLGLNCPPVMRPIWIHAASVGEARAVAPLANQLTADYPVLITTTTPTGRDQVTQLIPKAIHAFLPYDLPWAAQSWVRAIKPRAFVMVETELWPNWLASMKAAGVPCALINARLNAKSEAGYQRLSSLTQPMLGGLYVWAQDDQGAEAFKRLGAQMVEVLGNLKFDLPEPEERQLPEGRWIVGCSTHPTEAQALGRAFIELSQSDLTLKLLVVPRHPEKFDIAYRELTELGLSVGRSSQGEWSKRVVLGDQMGQLSHWLPGASVAFIGGTLVEHGGQSPIEAAQAACVLVTGPSRYNFAAVFPALPVVLDVEPGADLTPALAKALEADGTANAQVVHASRGATERTFKRLTALVEGKS